MRSLYRLLRESTRFAWERVEARTGRFRHLRANRRVQRSIPSVEQSIATIRDRWAVAAPSDEAPIFVLSAGWRSGSTLLQRLVMSSGTTLVWGEPFDHCDFVRRLADGLRAIGPEYPPDTFFELGREPGEGQLSSSWVANLYPPPAELLSAHRAFFETLYSIPARKAGYRRWGFKEVRLSLDYAAYLKWLFPAARFLFLYRDPYAAYRSYRTFRNWYDRWPTEPVLGPAQFGALWSRLTGSFVQGHAALGGLLIRFEDLVGGDLPVDRISEYLELPLSEEILAKRVSGRGDVQPGNVPGFERRILRKEVEPLAAELGYTG